MDDHNEMYEIGLTAPMEMAEEYRLDEMLPMMGLKIGKRCIILISRSVSAAEILDTLETLRCAEEKLMAVWKMPVGAVIPSARHKPFQRTAPKRSAAEDPGRAVVWPSRARSVPAATRTTSGQGRYRL